MKTSKELKLQHVSFNSKTKVHTFVNVVTKQKSQYKNDKTRKGSGILYKNSFLKPVVQKAKPAVQA